MINFHHNAESQVLLKLLVNHSIRGFCESLNMTLTTDKTSQVWFELLEVIHVIMRRYPLLVPKLARLNCAKVLHASLSEYPLLKGYVIPLLSDDSELPRKVSFLTVLIRLLVPYSTDKIRPLVMEMCLDT